MKPQFHYLINLIISSSENPCNFRIAIYKDANIVESHLNSGQNIKSLMIVIALSLVRISINSCSLFLL